MQQQQSATVTRNLKASSAGQQVHRYHAYYSRIPFSCLQTAVAFGSVAACCSNLSGSAALGQQPFIASSAR
eukprot:6298861-Amphidinium_carterae.1